MSPHTWRDDKLPEGITRNEGSSAVWEERFVCQGIKLYPIRDLENGDRTVFGISWFQNCQENPTIILISCPRIFANL